jgi:hypothetical protein
LSLVAVAVVVLTPTTVVQAVVVQVDTVLVRQR